MSTATLPPPIANPSPEPFVFHDVSWKFYEDFLEEFNERRIPHSYVNGALTVLSPSIRHETPKKWIARLVDVITEELDLPCRSLGSLLLKLNPDEKGAEPDECYLITNAPVVTDPLAYDIKKDPPPDLLIEIDITSLSLNRLPVYAAVGIPEIWVYNGTDLEVRLLREEGSKKTYATSDASRVFPTLPMKEFAAWIERAKQSDETKWIRGFRKWVRETLIETEDNS